MDAELALAHAAVALAREAGADEAEATLAAVTRFNVEARDRDVTKLEGSTGRNLAVRVYVGGAKATFACTDPGSPELAALAREAVAAARASASDAFAGLPEVAESPSSDLGLGTYAPDVAERPAESKIGDALELESIARAIDPRIRASGGSHVMDTSSIVAIANSRGFGGAYRASSAMLVAAPIAEDGRTKWTGTYASASRSYHTLEAVGAVAAKAARRALAMIGARKPPTMRCPVIFDRDVGANVLGDLFAAVSAANVALGNSFLAGKTGQRLGSDLVTIVDDGRLPHGLGTAPFDAEGVPTGRHVVFDAGVFATFLFDTYHGRKLGGASTGNAAGGSIGPTNFYLQPGVMSAAELIAATPRGVYITETIGFATESVTGTYSRGARGYLIEGGELAHPIDEFTIAGNLLDMLAAVDGIANDVVFDQSIVAPTFRVAEMTVSGTSQG